MAIFEKNQRRSVGLSNIQTAKDQLNLISQNIYCDLVPGADSEVNLIQAILGERIHEDTHLNNKRGCEIKEVSGTWCSTEKHWSFRMGIQAESDSGLDMIAISTAPGIKMSGQDVKTCLVGVVKVLTGKL